jgi:hypothetical protein
MEPGQDLLLLVVSVDEDDVLKGKSLRVQGEDEEVRDV